MCSLKGFCSAFITIGLALWTSPVFGATYFVATNGNDSNDGLSTSTAFRTIGKATPLVGPGDTIYVREGIYREFVEFTNSGTAGNYISIEGYGNEWPSIRGSDLVTNWIHHTNAIWKAAPWTNNSQQVFANGISLQQIGWPNDYLAAHPGIIDAVGLGYADLTNGSFFVDRTNDILYVWLPDGSSPSNSTMEVSTRTFTLSYAGSHSSWIHLRHLDLRHSSTLEVSWFGYPGVVLGSNSLVEQCRFVWADACGLTVRDNSRVADCDLSHNGNLGFAPGYCSNWVVSGCTIFSNNLRYFYQTFACGGMKCIPDAAGIVESNDIAWNYGPGVWFDYCTTRVERIVRGNYIHDNTCPPSRPGSPAYGVHMEVTKGGLIYNNLIVSNYGAAICVAGSDEIKCRNNTVVGNSGPWGGGVLEMAGIPREMIGGGWATLVSNEFVNNIIAFNPAPYLLYFEPPNTDPHRFVQGTVSDHNLFCRYGAAFDMNEAKSYILTNDLTPWIADTGHDSNSVIAVPVFDPVLAAHRMAIASNCAAVDAGGVTAAADYLNVPRPLDGNNDGLAVPDIGATEYVHPAADTDADGLGDKTELEESFSSPVLRDTDADEADDRSEYIAGTQPTNAGSVFSVRTIAATAGSSNHNVVVSTEPGRHYVIFYGDSGMSNNMTWFPFGNTNLGVGSWLETSPTSTTYTFTDDEGTNTTSSAPASGRRFYRFNVHKP